MEIQRTTTNGEQEQGPPSYGPAIILARKDATNFENNPPRIWIRGNGVGLESTDVRYTFREMTAKRKSIQGTPENPVDRELIAENMARLLMSEEGFVPANLGISLYITTTINGENFAVLVYQDRGDTMGDRVFKLISGYVDATGKESLLSSLFGTASVEANEEVLPSNGMRKMLPCSIVAAKEIIVTAPGEQALHGTIDRVNMPSPYPERFHYDSVQRWTLESMDNLGALPSLWQDRAISVEGTLVPNTGIYFDAAVGAAQLVFGFELQLPDVPGLTLAHAEDAPDSEPGHIVTEYHDGGLVLVKLDENGRLTNQSFWLLGGKLYPAHGDNITLSEVFSPRKEVATMMHNIALHEYLRPCEL